MIDFVGLFLWIGIIVSSFFFPLNAEELDLLIPETSEQIQKWLELGKPKGFKELPPKKKYPIENEFLSLNLSQVISSTLENQWNVQIAEQEVLRQEGITQATRGPFDPNVKAQYLRKWLKDAQTFGFKTGEDGQIDSVQVILEKLTRFGTQFSLNGEIARESNPSFSLDNSFNRTNQTTITFFIDQPLLRRLRYNEASVTEAVSEIELNALKYSLTQTMAENVRSALLIYWDLVEVQKVVIINENAKRILEALASATEKLVEGERVAASELNQQFAELARNNRELVAAQQDTYRIFNSLIFQMGIDRKQFPIELPQLLLDEFPLFAVEKDEWNLNHLLNIAMDNRGDLIAAQFRIEESALRLRLAEQEIYPELDVRVGYDLFNTQINKRAKPFFSSTETHKAQNNYSVLLNFSIPLFNNRAKGEKRRRTEEEIQANLAENQLQEDIRQSIATAFRNQLELIDQIHYARKTVKWYEEALKDEILRFKEGYGSLFIIIDYENRLRLTLIEEARIFAQWSKNIVDLLFQTGTLIERNACSYEMNIDVFNYQKLLNKHE